MSERMTNGVLQEVRLILAGCLVPTALARVMNPSGFAVTLATEGVPFATEMAAGAVVIGAVGPLALAVGVLPRATALLLVVHTLVTTLLLHRFWEFGGVFRQAEQSAFIAAILSRYNCTYLGVDATGVSVPCAARSAPASRREWEGGRW